MEGVSSSRTLRAVGMVTWSYYGLSGVHCLSLELLSL